VLYSIRQPSMDRLACAIVMNQCSFRHSSRNVGLADFLKEGRFQLPSMLLEADPPQHTRARNVLNKALLR
jgi:4-methoxybenzoate monooxygenase (O-demethylating)